MDDEQQMNELGSEVHIELEKPIYESDKKVQISLDEPSNIVDDEV